MSSKVIIQLIKGIVPLLLVGLYLGLPHNSEADEPAPVLSFIAPTPDDGATVSSSSAEIAITVDTSTAPLDTFKFNWNGTVSSFYDDSLVLAMNLNNNADIGEDATTAMDTSKYANNGTIAGAVWIDSGRFGQALEFDGENDYISIPNFRLPSNSKISIEFWLKAADLETDGESILSDASQSQSTGFVWILIPWSEYGIKSIALNYANGSDQYGKTVSWDYQITDTDWNHFVLVAEYDSDKAALYRDGALVGTRDIPNAIAPETDGKTVYIGTYSPAHIYKWNGAIDELRIYNRALSMDEIKLHYQSEFMKYNPTELRFYDNVRLADGTYTYYAWAKDTINNSSQTETRTLNADPPQSITGSLDAGGFTGEPFKWDYSLYIENPGGVTAGSDDPAHISWDGLTATFNYSDPGDYNVNLTFTPVFGNAFSGAATIRIVEKKEWGFPIVMWVRPVREDARNGDINAGKTVQALKDIGANTIICFLGYEERYNEFLVFLEQTKDSDIKIWSSLYPVDNHPYGEDFEAWAKHLAELSLQYPQLEAFTIDDLHPDKNRHFTPDYIENIMNSKDRVNPNLRFIPTLYFDSHDELKYFKVDSPYKPVLKDATFMWYWASFYGGSVNLTVLENFINEAKTTIHPLPFVTGIYPIGYGNGIDPFHPPDILKDMTMLATQNSDGVALFDVPLWLYDLDSFYNGTIFQQLENDDPAFDYKLGLPSGPWGTCISWYQAITQNISLPASISSANISFKIKDTRGTTSLTGYHFKQLLVNDVVIWDVDITEDGTDTLDITEDIASYLSGLDESIITIRFFDKKAVGNYPASIYVGNIEIHINGELINNNWIFESGIEDISKYMEVYNIVKDILKHFSKGSLTGTVKDADTGLAIEGAIVSDGTFSATTDNSGACTIPDIPIGTYTFAASADNYCSVLENVEITAGNTTTVNFELEIEDPTVSIDPTSLTFNATERGSNPNSMDVSVSYSGCGTLNNVSAGESVDWLLVTRSGSGNNQVLKNSVDIDGLADGTYDATVDVSCANASNSPQSYMVRLVISDGGCSGCGTSSGSSSALILVVAFALLRRRR